MDSVFVMSVGFILYTYLGYPVLMALLARLFRARVPDPAGYPPVAVLIPAYNEGQCIAEKLRNTLESDYPGPLRVIVVCDGVCDDTAAQVQSLGDARITLVVLPVRGGKMNAINRGMERVYEPVVVLTDAQELFARDAIRRLAQHFGDPRTGAVSGTVQQIDPRTGFARGLGAYWRYESWIRRCESVSGSTMGASGAIYALRRECFHPLPADTILDDVAIPFAALRRGYLIRYEPRAMAFEHATGEAGQEFARKRRTLAGNYQLIARHLDLLLPCYRGVAFRFWSHKVFRLLVPYALIGALAGAFWLPAPARWLVLGLQLSFYGLAAASVVAARPRSTLLSLPYAFCVLNWAAVAGSYYWLTGRQGGVWERAK